MSISKKIINEITNLNESNEFKKILIALLEIEDRGNHRNNQLFEKEVINYISEHRGIK